MVAGLHTHTITVSGAGPCLLAGQTLAASYPAAVESLPPAAEELRTRLGGLGGAGEVGLQSLAKVAAGEGAGRWSSFMP